MRRGLKIGALIVVYVFLCGKSCQDDRDMVASQLEEVEAMKENIREEFGTDYLSEESKYATELAALQKVSDLADYIGIFCDTSLDPAFREKAGEMILGMFISENARLSFGPIRNKKINYLTVEKFLTKGLGRNVASVEMFFDSLQVQKPLMRSGPGAYEGTILGKQKMKLIASTDTFTTLDTNIIIAIRASQTVKIFGKDTLNTWAIKLGDMTLAK
jgi:hypothetical protein